MVLHDSERKSERYDVDILVRNVDPRIAAKVSEKVVWRVKMGDGVSLVTDQVVEAVCTVGIDEAVANPATCADAIALSASRVDKAASKHTSR